MAGFLSSSFETLLGSKDDDNDKENVDDDNKDDEKDYDVYKDDDKGQRPTTTFKKTMMR